MKIINFGVNNYRCITGNITNNSINFENSNTIFILGQNNAGKSSFLKAYELFYENKTPNVEDFFMKDTSKPIEIIIEVELTNNDKQNFGKKLDNAEGKYFYGENNNRLTLKKVWSSDGKKSNDLTLLKDQSGFDDIGYAGVGDHNIIKPLLPVPIFIKAMPSETDIEDVINTIMTVKLKSILSDKENKEYKDAEETIKNLQKKASGNQDITTYKTKVNEYFNKMFEDIKINISEKESDVFKAIDKKFQVDFEFLDKDKKIIKELPTSFENIGHGAIRTALFSLFLMKDVASGNEKKSEDKGYLVLFEEPELFLHPKLTKKLRQLVYQVSADDTPFQVICASHSPQMIDITKPKSSLVRMVKEKNKTILYQIDESVLMDDKKNVKKELYEIIRFNPYICESFYADEVVLVEGDTEAVILRAYMQSQDPEKDIFIVNCGTVNNMPFFQDIFSRFHVKYHVICDSDGKFLGKFDKYNNPIFEKYIQGSIYSNFLKDNESGNYIPGIFRVNDTNFETAHRNIEDKSLQFTYNDQQIIENGKPFCANEYWNNILSKNLTNQNIDQVNIIKFFKEIIKN